MIVVDVQTFNTDINSRIDEVINILNSDLSESLRVKLSKEDNRKAELVCPKSMNHGYKDVFHREGYRPIKPFSDGIEIDFFKKKVGVEIQFGKYSFVFYDLFAKFQSCYNSNILDIGIEVIPSRKLYRNMSSGVACFDTEIKKIKRTGVEFPLVVLGIDLNDETYTTGNTLPL